MQEGPASRSYGLQVAQLAGVPADVIRKARDKLAELEAGSKPMIGSGTAPTVAPSQAELFSAPSKVEQNLSALDPDNMTPKDAMEALYQLKKLL